MPLYSQSSKLVKQNNDSPTDIEVSVSQALLDLEANSDLGAALRGLYFVAAEEIVIRDDKVRFRLINEILIFWCTK